MNTLKKYKKEVRELFFMSVRSDLDKWYKNSTGDFWSPSYTRTNNGSETYIIIARGEFDCYLKLRRTGDEEKICMYNWLIIPLDFKVWFYVRKLKKHFKKLEQDRKNAQKINFLEVGIENIEVNFVKEIRKEKLIQIKK